MLPCSFKCIRSVSYTHLDVYKRQVQEGSVIEIQLTTTDGKTLSTNLQLTKDDIEMIHTISEIARG